MEIRNSRFISFFILLFCLISTMSCGGGGNSDLEISVTPEETFLLPGDVTFSEDDACYTGTASSLRLRYDVFTTSWTGEGTFLPVLMTITLANGAVEQNCTISASQSGTFGAFLGYGGATLAKDSTGVTSSCPIICGGFNAEADGVTRFNIEVKLVGIQTKDDGSQIPVNATTRVRAESIQ